APLVEDREWHGLLPMAALDEAVAQRSPGAREHAAHADAARALDRGLRTAFRALAAADGSAFGGLAGEQRRFARANALWLERYERFEALGDGGRAHADAIAFFRFTQFVAERQRRTFRTTATTLGLRLFGDLPIGLAAADEWCHPDLFLERYRMGAPP